MEVLREIAHIAEEPSRLFASFDGTICILNGESLDITDVGSIEFTATTGAGSSIALLRDVCCAPKITSNLISNTN